MAKCDIIVDNNISTVVLAKSSLYEILSKEMEAFDWLSHWHHVMRSCKRTWCASSVTQ